MKYRMVNLGAVNFKIDRLAGHLVEAAHAIMERDVIEAVNYAKQHAPWVDRTGNARRSIDHVDQSDHLMIRFWLYIGVSYGQFLELSNQGKYRIIRPTATIYGHKMKRDLHKLGAIKK